MIVRILMCFKDLHFLAIDNFVVETSVTFAELSWDVLPNTVVDDYFYEIGFSATNADQVCSNVDPSLLPQPYTNTTISTAEVTGLEDNTCYVFGVRVYSSIRTGQPGNWTVTTRGTLLQGKYLVVNQHPTSCHINCCVSNNQPE